VVAGATAAFVLDSAAAVVEPTIVKVVLTEHKDHLGFRSGDRYRLHLRNSVVELHEFAAPMFLRSTTIEKPAMLSADRTDVARQPHESKDVMLNPHRKCSYSLAYADHDWDDSGQLAAVARASATSANPQQPRQMMSRRSISDDFAGATDEPVAPFLACACWTPTTVGCR